MKDIYNSLSKKLMQAKQSKAKRREEKRREEKKLYLIKDH